LDADVRPRALPLFQDSKNEIRIHSFFMGQSSKVEMVDAVVSFVNVELGHERGLPPPHVFERSIADLVLNKISMVCFLSMNPANSIGNVVSSSNTLATTAA
jgi:hypothetical protein